MVRFSFKTAFIGVAAASFIAGQASANVDKLNEGLAYIDAFEPLVNLTISNLSISFEDLYCGNLTVTSTSIQNSRLGSSEYSKQIVAGGLKLMCTTGPIYIADNQGNGLVNAGIEIESMDANVTTWLPVKDSESTTLTPTVDSAPTNSPTSHPTQSTRRMLQDATPTRSPTIKEDQFTSSNGTGTLPCMFDTGNIQIRLSGNLGNVVGFSIGTLFESEVQDIIAELLCADIADLIQSMNEENFTNTGEGSEGAGSESSASASGLFIGLGVAGIAGGAVAFFAYKARERQSNNGDSSPGFGVVSVSKVEQTENPMWENINPEMATSNSFSVVIDEEQPATKSVFASMGDDKARNSFSISVNPEAAASSMSIDDAAEKSLMLAINAEAEASTMSMNDSAFSLNSEKREGFMAIGEQTDNAFTINPEAEASTLSIDEQAASTCSINPESQESNLSMDEPAESSFSINSEEDASTASMSGPAGSSFSINSEAGISTMSMGEKAESTMSMNSDANASATSLSEDV